MGYNPYSQYQASGAVFAVDARVDERAAFIRKTYGHLLGAVLAFMFVETLLLNIPGIENLIKVMIGGRFTWLIVIGLFMGVSYVANRWAQSTTSLGMQYAGLALYVVAEAIIFLPLLYVAAFYAGASVIPTAAILTGAVFLGMTAIVFLTGKNFSFMGPFLAVAGFGAIGLILVSMLFGFSLGSFFCFFMVVLAAGYILFHTSAVMHEYRTDQYVAASLALFASVALLFYYMLMLVMGNSRD